MSIRGHLDSRFRYFNRTELFGNIGDGMNEDYIYKANMRAVLDFEGVLWKLSWLGVGRSNPRSGLEPFEDQDTVLTAECE